MREAKARNPSIRLFALSWTFPEWTAEGQPFPLTNSTADYTVAWIVAAKAVHNLTIDYVGHHQHPHAQPLPSPCPHTHSPRLPPPSLT